MSNLDIWSDGYYESTVAACKTIFEGDKTYFVNDSGVMKKQENVLSQLCLNNCSNHGTCVSGNINITISFNDIKYELIAFIIYF